MKWLLESLLTPVLAMRIPQSLRRTRLRIELRR